MFLRHLYFLLISLYITTALRSLISIKNLSTDEDTALFNARKLSQLQTLNLSQKALLCVTFTSLRSENSWQNLLQNVKYAKEQCEWLVLSYNAVNEEILSSRSSLIEDVARSANTLASIMRHSFGSIEGVLKPLLFDSLLPTLQLYKKVWLMDEDISIVGFDFRLYFGIWDCAFDTASPPPVITQPLVHGNKYMPPFTQEGWAMYKNSVTAIQSVWIEQQSPMLDAKFFSWFIENFILPLKSEFIHYRSDFWYDLTWCGAAEMWNQVLREAGENSTRNGQDGKEKKNANNPPCVIIMADNYVNHMDFKTIVDWHANKTEWIKRSKSLAEAFKIKFPNTFNNRSVTDCSFYDKQRWYSKSSGTCKHKAFLQGFPNSIIETPQIRQDFLSYTFRFMGTGSRAKPSHRSSGSAVSN